jgi:hypothetical protein
MGTVLKKTFTKPVPTDAEMFTRKGIQFARWKDGKDKTRTAKMTTGKDGSPRLQIEAETFTAKYRDGAGIVQEVATGCRDETAARQVLADLVKRSELVKGKILTVAQGISTPTLTTWRAKAQRPGIARRHGPTWTGSPQIAHSPHWRILAVPRSNDGLPTVRHRTCRPEAATPTEWQSSPSVTGAYRHGGL